MKNHWLDKINNKPLTFFSYVAMPTFIKPVEMTFSVYDSKLLQKVMNIYRISMSCSSQESE